MHPVAIQCDAGTDGFLLFPARRENPSHPPCGWLFAANAIFKIDVVEKAYGV
jgi:hypothetical protein